MLLTSGFSRRPGHAEPSFRASAEAAGRPDRAPFARQRRALHRTSGSYASRRPGPGTFGAIRFSPRDGSESFLLGPAGLPPPSHSYPPLRSLLMIIRQGLGAFWDCATMRLHLLRVKRHLNVLTRISSRNCR